MHVLDRYLRELHEIHSTGAAVPETSYYGALESLLNEIGRSLKPRVRAIINLQNRGAGIPDGGFFTANQLKAMPDGTLLKGQIPERGVFEVKGPAEDLRAVSTSEQVRRYLMRYGLILVTNYRDFILLGKDESGQVTERERYRLAESEPDLWRLAANPQGALKIHGERFREYLKRVLLHLAPLESPRDVSWFLASYARDASARLEGVDLPALASIREALEASLGVRFDGPKGEHFFRSTLVQTLFYGIFSAWVLWQKEGAGRRSEFDWRLAGWLLKVPMIQALFEQLTSPTQLRRLGLVEVLDWAAETLKRVRSQEFFAGFEEDRAVQYFYEPFLERFDPQLRKALGVWFTPPEVVRYMVARVDQALRSELGVEDGLADPRVVVLDPCCGTGAYLLETLRCIAATLREKGGGDALAAQDLKQIVMERIFGFELLPAPFVVAHLQLGLLLQAMHVPLSEDKGERAGIYLSNALTGWELPVPPKQHVIFPELEQERDGAVRVKREAPILVILGNPPYNAFAGVSPSSEERRLVEVYKRGLISKWGVKKFNLDELYVRFFRIAERRITEMTGEGIVCYISNFSYLSDPSFVVLRERFVQEFDSAWIDCLNGDSRETGKTTPAGDPDPSIFSTEYNREGIRVGTAIGLFVRKREGRKGEKILFRHLWGSAKREALIASLEKEDFAGQYEVVHAGEANQYSFRPNQASASYLSWPRLDELAEVRPILGVLEKRKAALCSIEKESLEARMRRYGDSAMTWEDIAKEKHGLTENAAAFDARSLRKRFLEEGGFQGEEIRRLLVRPLDYRWCYYSKIPGLWNRSRPALIEQCWEGNSFLVCRNKAVAAQEGIPFYITDALGDEHAFHKDAYYLPLRIRRSAYRNHVRDQVALLEESATTANVSHLARGYLAEIGFDCPDGEAEQGLAVWRHVLAVGYAPAYLEENAAGLRQGWPRIPLPRTLNVLRTSAELGARLAVLLDVAKNAPGVSRGRIRPDLQSVSVISRAGGGSLNPGLGDLELSAGWGHLQKGIIMPGRGRLQKRSYLPEELEAIEKGGAEIGVTLPEALGCLGGTTCDIWLNEHAFWKNVPSNVWGFTIGGYQVLKKWLSYRDREVLGRGLTSDEVRDVTGMARRLAAVLLMHKELNASYRAVKQHCWFQQPTASAGRE